MKHPFNYLGLLSLPALAALLYFPTGKIDFIGFLGFLAFFRYFWVNPDELFLHTLRRSATAAYLVQCVTLAPFMLVFFALDPQSNPVGPALAASFAVALVFFSKTDATSASQAGFTPCWIQAYPSVRYIAPVSIYKMPSLRATSFAAVLFPEPAGPSTATAKF